MKNFACLTILLIIAGTVHGGVVMIHNGGTEAGILPDAGGRVVILRQSGGRNLLRAVPELWEKTGETIPVPDAMFPTMKSYFGQIVWLGPQSDWWIQQDINMKLRDRKSQWPPDPFLIVGKYTIAAQSDSSLLLNGPDSPVSGVRLVKSFRIDSAGRVHFKVTAHNIRNTAVQWDLWCNMRLPGLSRCYVPVADSTDVRIDMQNGGHNAIRHEIRDGYFTFIPRQPEKGRFSAKAFINPAEGFIAGFQPDQMVMIHFVKLKKENIHPNQGQVEIYSDLFPNASAALLELEHHSAYQQIPAGGELAAEEIWEIRPYEGQAEPDDQIRFLNEIRAAGKNYPVH